MGKRGSSLSELASDQGKSRANPVPAQTAEVAPTSEKPKASKARLYPQIPLPPDAVSQWNDMIMPQINMALKHFYRKYPESVEISLESIGESPAEITPTVLVVCTSVSKVRSILKKKLGILFDGSTGFGLKVCRGSMLRSRKGGASRSMAKNDEEGSDMGEGEVEAANPDYQERPHNGASIGAWIGDRHLPPVSFGGLIMVDDKPYGMTVHHMLDDPERGHTQKSDEVVVPPVRSSAASQSFTHLQETDTSESSSGDDFTCEFSDTESDYSVTDLTSDDESEDEEEEYTEPGDIPGIEPGLGEGYVVTQPALDDIGDGFYPTEDTMDEDHLDTCRLGEVYASSGIRRRHDPQGLIHEIDWALFSFEDERLPDHDQIWVPQALPDSPNGLLQPTAITSWSELAGLEVQCIGRTSGMQTGLIMPALTSVKIYGRASPSHTYQVSSKAAPITGSKTGPAVPELAAANMRRIPGLSLGIPGDSGAWIMERHNGSLCGHVLAWSERKQVAYICPMEVLMLDIAETLEASDVRLPGGRSVLSRRRRQEVEELSDLVGDEDEEEEEVEDDGVDVDEAPSDLTDSMRRLAEDLDRIHMDRSSGSVVS
ncbi:hypothetical protein PG988_016122 [Apiospora saccharicola]